MTYDEMVESCQKTNKKKAGKRKRSPSPANIHKGKGGSMNDESVNGNTLEAVKEIQGKLERKKKEHLDIEKGIACLERKQEESERAMMEVLEREKKKIKKIEEEKKVLSDRRQRATDEIKSLEDSLNKYSELTKTLVTKLELESWAANNNLIKFLAKSIEEKEEELACPVCLMPASAPIFSCQQMHLICSSCQPKLTLCPVCREPYQGPPRRHRYAERDAQELKDLQEELANLAEHLKR